MSKIDDIAGYYDTHSVAGELEAAIASGAARWETNIDPNPMIGVTVRLPKSVLDAVREAATRRRVKPTALIRQWVENAVVHPDVTNLADVTALEHIVRRSVHDELVKAKLAA